MDAIVHVHFSRSNGFISTVQKKTSAFTSNPDVLSSLPGFRVVSTRRFITHDVVLAFPSERYIEKRIIIKYWNATLPRNDTAFSMFLDCYNLSRLHLVI